MMIAIRSNPLPSPLPEGRGNKIGGVNRNAGWQTKRNAKSLRKKMTEVEKILWYHLRAQRFERFKFRRQHPLGKYIVDFVCLREKLIIELDGGQHAENSNDMLRTKKLESLGFKMLRFWNNEITENLESVLEKISLSLQGEGQGEGA